MLLWKTFYDASATGVFNTILGWIGLGPYPWLQSQHWAMPSLVLESTWANAGATVIIYLAALTAVDTDLYEAAAVDGAGLWRKIWHITLPQLRYTIVTSTILMLVGGVTTFDLILILTGGGPGQSTLVLSQYIYQTGFQENQFGYASAISVVLFALCFLVTIVQFSVNKRRSA